MPKQLQWIRIQLNVKINKNWKTDGVFIKNQYLKSY